MSFFTLTSIDFQGLSWEYVTATAYTIDAIIEFYAVKWELEIASE